MLGTLGAQGLFLVFSGSLTHLLIVLLCLCVLQLACLAWYYLAMWTLMSVCLKRLDSLSLSM